MKELVRTICRSRIYQLSASPNTFNAADRQSFSHFYARRLPAEVMLDAIDQFDGTHTSFSGMPAKARAVQTPDMATVSDSYFLNVFGRPAGSMPANANAAAKSVSRRRLRCLIPVIFTIRSAAMR